MATAQEHAAPASRWIATGRYIGCLGAWTVVSTFLIVTLVALSGKPAARAVALMGGGLVLFWIVLGGLLSRLCRDRVRAFVRAIPWDWRLKFVLFCTLLALVEEAVTTLMTNCAPLFGVPVGRAYITASANYLDVVCLHSVVVFVPMFAGWAWMLARWDFHPNAVFLLFGATGTLAEMSFGGWQHAAEYGMWTFVYGLMVYLPAYSLPSDRGASGPKPWHYPLAVFLPNLFVIPVAVVVGLLHPVKIHFPPIPPG